MSIGASAVLALRGSLDGSGSRTGPAGSQIDRQILALRALASDAIKPLVHPSGIEGLIFGSWAMLSGERLSCVGPAEGPGHGGVEISDELLDPGLQHLLAGEVAAADKLSYQNGKPDFDLIEP